MDEVQLDQQLAEIFFLESAEMLNDASLTLLGAEAAGNPSEAIHKVFRAVHSIKGGAQSLGFEELAEVAHCMEAFMVPFQHGEDAVDGQTVSLMLESMDVIEDQLKAYQSGEMPAKYTDFLVKLAEATALLIGDRNNVKSDSVIVSQQEAMNRKSRLLHLSFIVDQTATMPGMTAFLLLDRLRSSGRLLYSQPDIDNSSMTAVGESLTQVAIIETDMSNDAVKQEAYSVGDILDIKISEIDGKKKSNTDQPTKEEISDLNCLVSMMWKELCNKKSYKGHVKDLARQITAWGAASSGAAGWFHGGLPAWKRLTLLLTDTLSLKETATVTSKEQALALKALRLLWETVYNALCGQTYFYSFIASDMLSGNGLQVIKELEARGVDSQIIIIDLSSWEIFEAKHLKTLAQIKNKILENGWDLRLISEGEYTRRHVNVLEISKNIVGQLDFYSSIYSAVITRENCD
ncbi:MAG: chemotaxis protein CheA [Firmicutes bacterium]|nr:chemotaxis protein CheA [Bacillota bacterium]